MTDKQRLNYVGAKGGQGIREILVNYIPLSERYFSLFYGKGSFENCKYMKSINWICSELNLDLHAFSTMTAVIAFSNYRDLIAEIDYTAADFIFADPPYTKTTRRSGRSYYKFEFTEADHVQFLTTMIDQPSRILITHPKCDLYDKYLAGWHCIEFQYMTHKGFFNDAIYYNYDALNLPLVNYSCLGSNFMERQQIKRKRNNFINKYNNLTSHERQAILQKLNLKSSKCNTTNIPSYPPSLSSQVDAVRLIESL